MNALPSVLPINGCLIHLVPIPAERLALHMVLVNTEVNLVARVVWRGPLGPFYGTGAEFISKLQHFPQHADFTDFRW